MSWLEDWWGEQRASCAQALAVMGVQPYATHFPPPVEIPAYPWMPDGTPIRLGDGEVEGPMPVSFVAAGREKLHVVMNLDRLKRSVMAALSGQPDTRTPAQQASDAWKAYQEAKKRWEK